MVRGHILFAFVLLMGFGLVYLLAKELVLIYVSALFAAVLMPIVNRIMQTNIRGRRPSKAAAIFLIVSGIGLIVGIFLTVGLPPVLHDLNQFSAELPSRISKMISRLDQSPIANRLGVDAIAQRAEGALTTTASYLMTSLPNWLSHLFDIVSAIFLCIYFMLDGDRAYNFALSLFPTPHRQRLKTTLGRADDKISNWLIGQGLLMLILGISSTIVFAILHVRYFLLLGFLMGLFNIIPIAGGVVTITLSAIVAAFDSWTKMAGVIVFYIFYINVENAYLIPRIMGSSVELSGLTILISLLCGTALAGVVGALVAVPTAALIAVLLDEYAVYRDETF
ncbi:AI-2E family transporter [Edaphobacter sp. 12200R-103]|uniref:AI-2E family transporter n=1 Tax=Edaphobacter sp. 12200R-103 TaxID=2703788 RepID=UPI001EE3B379|nr:AI-2E family transporter [Edaphobacter sp. 12200R-103]